VELFSDPWGAAPRAEAAAVRVAAFSAHVQAEQLVALFHRGRPGGRVARPGALGGGKAA
jgi:hypothetical protein